MAGNCRRIGQQRHAAGAKIRVDLVQLELIRRREIVVDLQSPAVAVLIRRAMDRIDAKLEHAVAEVVIDGEAVGVEVGVRFVEPPLPVVKYRYVPSEVSFDPDIQTPPAP